MTNQDLDQIKTYLSTEDTSALSSFLVDGRNVFKQIWLNEDIEVLKDRPQLASCQKAKDRYDICMSCEFFKYERCTRNGSYMYKKVHIEISECPINKWGPTLQILRSEELVQSNLQPKLMKIDTSKLPEIVRQQFLTLAEQALSYDGKFMFEGKQYAASKNQESVLSVYEVAPKENTKTIKDNLTAEERTEFDSLVAANRNAASASYFSFKNKTIKISPSINPNNGQQIFRITEVSGSLQNYLPITGSV